MSSISEIQSSLSHLNISEMGNINKYEFIMYLFEHFIEITLKKFELISFTNSIFLNMGKSYRDLFHLEYYVMNLLNYTT